MGLDKTQKKNWREGDTFAVKIENHSKEYDGRYLILIKASYDDNIECKRTLYFRVKITKNKAIPTTIEELNDLEYIITGTLTYIERLLPLIGLETLKEAIKRVDSEKKCYKDEYGYLNEYRMALVMKKEDDYSNFVYLGNFDLTLPRDEYVSEDIWYYYLENSPENPNLYFINRLLTNYEDNNLRKSEKYIKEKMEMIHKKAQGHVELLYNYTENFRRKREEEKKKFSLKNGWGIELYDCDLALDIEDDFTELYYFYQKKKITKEELVQDMEKKYNKILNNPISGPVFWIILADQQIPNKVLTEYTKEKALESIDLDLENWKNKEGYLEREKILETLKEDLEKYRFKK